MKKPLYSRRQFLGALATAGAAWGLGLPRRMSWAVSDGPRETLRFVFFTDVHAREEWDTPLALEQAAAAIRAQAPDLVIGGGDFITDGFESPASFVEPRWKVFLRMWEDLPRPRYPALGNHDLVAVVPANGSPPSADPRAIYREKLQIPQTYYAFEAAGYRFVVVDGLQITGQPYPYRGFVDDTQCDWLRRELETADPEQPVVLVSHLPLLTAFYQATEGGTAAAPEHRVLVNNREVLQLFEGRNLVLVLQGHLHVEEWLRWRRTMFITGGAICGKWWRGSWYGTDAGFGVVTLRGNRVDWEYLTFGWVPRRVETALGMTDQNTAR